MKDTQSAYWLKQYLNPKKWLLATTYIPICKGETKAYVEFQPHVGLVHLISYKMQTQMQIQIPLHGASNPPTRAACSLDPTQTGDNPPC